MSTMQTTATVIRATDDRDIPTRGHIIGWEDGDRCLVLWGDAIHSGDPDRARIEFADELVPAGRVVR